MVERRGRPSEQPAVALDKWVLETEDQTWYFDRSKSPNGCYKVVNKFVLLKHSLNAHLVFWFS